MTALVHPVDSTAARAADRPPPIEDFIREHQTGIWRYLRLLGAEPGTGDDLTQEAFLVAMRRGVLRQGFALRTARHLWLRSQRNDLRRAEHLAEIATRLWQDEYASDGGSRVMEALQDCVELLDGRARQCITRAYRDGASRSELAHELGLQENGVKTLLQRVRAQLRSCIEGKMKA